MEAMGKPALPSLERRRSVGRTERSRAGGAVRHGDDRAFEVLYSRYQRRIAAYVYGMVKDHGRAEDITQEVFVSALRRMRQTERPIAFKPWIYEIAKNACIDAYRRGRRAEEVSFDAEDRLSAADHGRLVAAGPGPDAAVDTKQDLDHLCGAFGGLSDTHHEILVMRELEGRSYKDIGERMGMSRPAVESTLFRARKRLERGVRRARVRRALPAHPGDHRRRRGRATRLGRARPAQARPPHRRTASRAGASRRIAGLEVPVPARTRVAEKIAAPAAAARVPAAAARRRRGRCGVRRGGGGRLVAHVPTFADPLGPAGARRRPASPRWSWPAPARASPPTWRQARRARHGLPARGRAQRRSGGGDAGERHGRGRPRPAAGRERRGAAQGRAAHGRRHRAARRRARAARTESAGGGSRRRGRRRPRRRRRRGAPTRTARGGGGGDRAGGGDTARKADREAAGDPPCPTSRRPRAATRAEAPDDRQQRRRHRPGRRGQRRRHGRERGLDNVQKTVNEPQNLLPNVANTVNDAVDGRGQHRERRGQRARTRRSAACSSPDRAANMGRYLGAWRSLVARTVRVGEVPSSNLGAPM